MSFSGFSAPFKALARVGAANGHWRARYTSEKRFFWGIGPRLFYGVMGCGTVYYVGIAVHYWRDPGWEWRPSLRNQKFYGIPNTPEDSLNFRFVLTDWFGRLYDPYGDPEEIPEQK